MKKLFIVISLIGLLLIVSCTTLGSSSTIHDSSKLSKLGTISIAPVEIAEEDLTIYKKARESANKYIKNYITRNTSIKIIEGKSQQNSEKKGIVETEDSPKIDEVKADAILIPRLQLIPKKSYWMTWFDAELKIRLEDTRTNKIIFESSHNTTLGNSYMSIPQPDQVISDAVKGALKILSK